MDMTLYALLMRKLQDQKECLTWNGTRVEVVDAIPESPQPNTIYFVKSDIQLQKGEINVFFTFISPS